ncbi:hypothetical protein APA22_41110 (plasmid) [Acetobacter pasteurianus IFO 3283-22]|nr:hypothetical protein APA01_41110 [Acetobacter pasteurianus IFO 3283-01]BAI03946.1 hypothetical protein APA03_41110 [Acetobacter pasteurianus IFO 3283-03]BAI06993.1 hypothetical protein APA07_41110 [Acetobacter pasteurianus IFO 3283-07]BAI10041.1 hypothetical protein APA22_41110 [Acetobacter pasteurianus IFO 3283-22]BAI13089.1 hypothetical protein APA26_41110 [Acetobacter pasteurianus IFO 3283-26]BAI16135.1 hypothetical protein APA32_41110 [Acetobacter pasteurianus IFO 3283-32]BAI19119.1 hy
MCGEHRRDGNIANGRGGSSPRVRGTRAVLYTTRRARRFIPACAGNTPAGSAFVTDTPVHPRVCGEHSGGQEVRRSGGGSSPRVRGTLESLSDRPDARRFIPACAGNTRRCTRKHATRAVHPRVCGEHYLPDMEGLSTAGSSPRVRGTRSEQVLAGRGRRFIPACAGNTRIVCITNSRPAVHPRVCGEHTVVFADGQTLNGSSPRVRGTPENGVWRRCRYRFIPACAGNTLTMDLRHGERAVHPRVCGEHHDTFHSSICLGGSSPRVRGTRPPPLPP